ncbi:hypothetical protein ABFV05_020306 [Capra hircus]
MSPTSCRNQEGKQRTDAGALRSEGREGAGNTRSQGITLVVEMSELSKPEEDFQDPGEAQGPVNAQLLGAEAGVAASASASSPTVSSLGTGESLPQEALNEMIASLMKFLLLKYRAKEPTSQAEMLNKVLRDNQEYFLVVFSQASQCLQLVFGVEVKEVDPREHIYIMGSILGLSCNAMLSSGQSIPKAGLLVLVLNLIMRNGDRAPEEKNLALGFVLPGPLSGPPLRTGAAGTRRGRQRTEARAPRSEGREGAGSTRSQGITLVVEMSELSKPEEDFQDPGEAQGPVNAQLLGAEAGVAASASASSPTVSSLGTRESLPQEALNEMIASLMKFLLLKYRAKEPTSQAEMLNKNLALGFVLPGSLSGPWS